MNFILKAKIEDGKLIFFNPSRYQQLLKSMSGVVDIVFRKVKTPRSSQQNRYYWGVIIKILADELGYSPEDAHFALRLRFLRRYDGEAKPTPLYVPKSTTDLSTKDFEAYQEDIRRWAASFLYINIPEPNEVEV